MLERTSNPAVDAIPTHDEIVARARDLIPVLKERAVEDAANLILYLIRSGHVDETVNVANPRSSSMTEIVEALEAATRHPAVYRVVDRGASYEIDTSPITEAIASLGIPFGESYLSRTVAKYYCPP